ncbi:MAG TPA: SDR family NAD(P)-dependent oxidoreductase [Nocardioides sp.]|nr:SDR family NAD(P)-dependent oxidoreductase [Nocardioides sp.]
MFAGTEEEIDMDELRLDDRVAIVTGAGRGLGREYAKLLAARGAAVVVNDLGGEPDGTGTSDTPARTAVTEILEAGGAAVINTDTVATEEGGASVVECAVREFGRIDIVVNNAGIMLSAPFADTSAEDFRRSFDVNFFGTVNVLRAAWPHLGRTGAGRVINTVSSAMLGYPGLSTYGAAKAAVLGLTRTLALEGAAGGIRVNAIAPGGFTRLFQVQSGGDGAVSEEIERASRELMPPALNAPLVAYLAHESCTLNGEILSSTGGRFTSIVVGETTGVVDRSATPESIQADLDRITDIKTIRPLGSLQDQVDRILADLT